jgi:hypothetical protein
MTKTTIATAILSLVFLGACAADDHGPKPETNPDESVLDTGKADYLTRNLVSFQGSLELNGSVDSAIDYPDWLHGYTFRAEAGDQISVYMNTDEFGYFFVYGPSHRVASDGTPRFRESLHGAYTDEASNGYRAGYDLNADEAGTYLVVYGPAYAWSADYHIEINCADCSAPGECHADDECAAGEFCGDNGVRCIVAPCTANYDVCQPAGVDGDWCDRNEMCQGFCGWDASNERVCKPWAQEGDSCGGFVLPDFRNFCEPGLSCECSEATCDIPGTCVLP